MKDLFDDVDWPLVLRRMSLLAAIGLLIVSYVGFSDGLNFSGAWYVAAAIWVAFTVIQFIGNYQENHTDWVFLCVWIFTYLVGIGAGTWAAFGWIGIDNPIIHWICAVGLGGAAELVPERLIALFIRSLKMGKKSFNNGYTKPTAPANSKPISFNREPPRMSPAASFRPKPSASQKPQYRNLNTDPMKDYEEPRF